jgi:5'-nucleotidase
MRILVCNDDGLASPGLALLAAAARSLSPDTWVVAPARKWTAASHQLTFDRDVTLTRRGERTFECDAAPADCVVAALTALFAPHERPGLVLGGINDARNVGEDVAYSGTMAIAREAALWGIPAIAWSRHRRWPDGPGETEALAQLLARMWQDRAAWAGHGAWLAVGLPDRLPAPLTQAAPAHDKIGTASDIVQRSDERVVYRLRRGRAGVARPGDENAALQAGNVVVARHAWACNAPLDADLLGRWSAAPRTT